MSIITRTAQLALAGLHHFAPWRKIGVDSGIAVIISALSTAVAWFALHLTPATFGERWTTGGPDQVLHYLIFRSATQVFPFVPNTDLGFPRSQNLFFAPLFDPWSAIFVGLASLVTDNSILILNSFLILTFFGTTFTAYIFFRLLKLNRVFSATLGLAFSLLPLHFMQLAIGHPFLANYWAVPLTGVILLMVGGPRTNPFEDWIARSNTTGMRAARRWIPIASLSLLVGLTQSYYFVFAAILVGGVLLLRVVESLIHRLGVRLLLWPALTVGSLAVVVVAQVSVLSLNFGDRYAKYFASRTAAESEFYAGKLASLILPWPGTGFPKLGALSEKYFSRSQVLPTSEGPWSSVLVVISIAVLALFILVSLLGPIGRRSRGGNISYVADSPKFGLLSTGFLWTFFFYITGGLGVVFAFLVSPEIRAWSRISVLISLFALAALGMLLQRVVRGRAANIAAIALISITVLIDQVGGAYKSVPLTPTADSELKALVVDMQKEFSPGCGIVELPLKGFPESGNIGAMGDYDHGLPYLYSTTLRWSYGAVTGTKSGDVWNSLKTPSEIGAQIKASKACGVLVNTKAYVESPNGWADTVGGVADVSKPTLTSKQGTYLVFSVQG